MKRLILITLLYSCGITIDPSYSPPTYVDMQQVETVQDERLKALLRYFYSTGFTDGYRSARSGWNSYNAEKDGFERAYQKIVNK